MPSFLIQKNEIAISETKEYIKYTGRKALKAFERIVRVFGTLPLNYFVSNDGQLQWGERVDTD